MRNYFLSISTIIVLLLSSCSNDEVNISDSPTLNKEKLDYSDERGKMMYNIIISMKTVNNPLEIQEKLMLLEEKSIKTNYRINNNVEFTETEIEIYGELLNCTSEMVDEYSKYINVGINNNVGRDKSRQVHWTFSHDDHLTFNIQKNYDWNIIMNEWEWALGENRKYNMLFYPLPFQDVWKTDRMSKINNTYK